MLLKATIFAVLASIQIDMMLNHVPKPERGINPQIKPYVERFVEYAKKYKSESYVLPMVNMDIGQVYNKWDFETSEDVVGWCKPYLFPFEIMIQGGFWITATDADKEEIVFHELGHCVLALTHTEAMNGTLPKSIMYPYLLGSAAYKPNREYYIKELFTRKNE